MTRLPVISGREAVRAFGKIGYRESHQTGSHIILRHEDPPHRHLSVPNHREVAKGPLRGLIRDAGLTVDKSLRSCEQQRSSARGAEPNGWRSRGIDSFQSDAWWISKTVEFLNIKVLIMPDGPAMYERIVTTSSSTSK